MCHCMFNFSILSILTVKWISYKARSGTLFGLFIHNAHYRFFIWCIAFTVNHSQDPQPTHPCANQPANAVSFVTDAFSFVIIELTYTLCAKWILLLSPMSMLLSVVSATGIVSFYLTSLRTKRHRQISLICCPSTMFLLTIPKLLTISVPPSQVSVFIASPRIILANLNPQGSLLSRLSKNQQLTAASSYFRASRAKSRMDTVSPSHVSTIVFTIHHRNVTRKILTLVLFMPMAWRPRPSVGMTRLSLADPRVYPCRGRQTLPNPLF